MTTATPNVMLGSPDKTRVRWIQQRLDDNGFHVKVDGVFGAKTRIAVIQYQAAHGLVADGIVGNLTWDSLSVASRVSLPTAQRTALAAYDAAWNKSLDADVVAVGYEALHARERRFAVLRAAVVDVGRCEFPDGSNEGPQLAHLLRDKDGRTYWQVWGVTGLKPPAWCAIGTFGWIFGQGDIDPNEPARRGRPDWKASPMGHWYGAVFQWEAWAREVDASDPTARVVYASGDGAMHTLVPDDFVGAVFTTGRAGSSSDPSETVKDGHQGLVLGRSGMEFLTLECNVHNQIEFRTRTFGEIRMLIRWWRAPGAGGTP